MPRTIALCGAGISAAPPLSLPTTFQFFDRIIGKGADPNHPLNQGDITWPLKGLLTALFGSDDLATHDLETFYQFLGWIGTANPKFIQLAAFFFDETTRNSWFDKQYLGLREIATGFATNSQQYQRTMKWLEKAGSILRQSFHQEYFVPEGRGADAADVYLPLVALLHEMNLEKTANGFGVAPIYTLNWDTSWEAMRRNIQVNKQLRDLLQLTKGQRLISEGFVEREMDFCYDPEVWMGNTAFPGIKLVRLHGSVFWRRSKQTGAVYYIPTPEHPDIRTDHEPCLIYPAQKEESVIGEPWSSLLSAFRQALHDTDVVLVLGYSFRDGHINQLLLESMNANKKLQIIAVNPTKFSEISKPHFISHEFFSNLDDKRLTYIDTYWPEALTACRDKLASITIP